VFLPWVLYTKNTKLRLIHDLRRFNDHCSKTSFQYEDIRVVAKCIEPRDRLVTLDIKNGFHHVTVADSDRNYLGIKWRCVYYRLCVLPFRLSCSPYIFVVLFRE
jgi:hypothetical protein